MAYWKTIAELADRQVLNKDNADCVRDPLTQARLKHHHRDLEALGDYLLDYYAELIDEAGLEGRALAGELPFRWQTDFDFPWLGGWLKNQKRRNVRARPGGRHPRPRPPRAVIMADHYDTAYMEDDTTTATAATAPRLAAAGADDNHSATAALMLGAPIFLDLSRPGKLAATSGWCI